MIALTDKRQSAGYSQAYPSMLTRYKLYDRQTNPSGGQSWTRTQQRRIASRTRSQPGHATSYLSSSYYYYYFLFLAGGHFDATKEKRPLDTKKVSAFVYNTHERIMCKKFCRLSLSKKFLLFICKLVSCVGSEGSECQILSTWLLQTNSRFLR